MNGDFGDFGRVRREVVVEGAEEAAINDQTVWKEYGSKGKPGAAGRLPRQWARYHAQQWPTPLLQRLLRDDRPTPRLSRA
jgi:hypothetical protein